LFTVFAGTVLLDPVSAFSFFPHAHELFLLRDQSVIKNRAGDVRRRAGGGDILFSMCARK